MASDIWLRTILIVRKETRCRHIGYSYRLTARVLLYAPSHRQDNTYHSLCYTSHGALAGTRNSSMGPPHEGSIRRSIAPWANALPPLEEIHASADAKVLRSTFRQPVYSDRCQGPPMYQNRRHELSKRASTKTGARCSSMVRAFAHGAMGRQIDPSWGGPIELFLVSASAPRLV